MVKNASVRPEHLRLGGARAESSKSGEKTRTVDGFNAIQGPFIQEMRENRRSSTRR